MFKVKPLDVIGIVENMPRCVKRDAMFLFIDRIFVFISFKFHKESPYSNRSLHIFFYFSIRISAIIFIIISIFQDQHFFIWKIEWRSMEKEGRGRIGFK